MPLTCACHQAAPGDVGLERREGGDAADFTRMPSVVSWHANTHHADPGSPPAVSISPSRSLQSITRTAEPVLDGPAEAFPAESGAPALPRMPSVVTWHANTGASGLGQAGSLDAGVLERMIEEASRAAETAPRAATHDTQSESPAAQEAAALTPQQHTSDPVASQASDITAAEGASASVAQAGADAQATEAAAEAGAEAKPVAHEDATASASFSARIKRWSLLAASSIAAGFYTSSFDFDVPSSVSTVSNVGNVGGDSAPTHARTPIEGLKSHSSPGGAPKAPESVPR